MSTFFKKRWPLLLLLIIFIAFKVPHLFYPYYWDESWHYAAAVKAMYNNGVSLVPGAAISGELSRGHPLFFHAAAATWMNIFGASHVSMHSFALLISIFCLITIYEAGLKMFNERAAILGSILAAVQPLFFLQSSFLLPEILVAWLSFFSLYSYVQGRYLVTAISLTALFYTKESGLIMGFVIGVDALVNLFDQKCDWHIRLYRILSIAIPIVLIGGFFIIQKHVSGWYILPLYSNIIEHSWKAFWYKFRMGSLRDIFHENMRYWYLTIVLFLSLIATIKHKRLLYLAMFLPATVLYYYVDDMRAGRLLPSVPFFIVFIITICFFIYSLIKLKLFKHKGQEKMIYLIIIFIFLYSCFSAMNFYINRYLLSAIIPMLFLAAVLFDKYIQLINEKLFYAIIAGIACIGIFSLSFVFFQGDTREALDGMLVQQKIIDYMEQHLNYDSGVSCVSFLEREHLSDPSTGFLNGNRPFKNVTSAINSDTKYVVFDNIETTAGYADFIKDTTFSLLYRTTQENLWGEIFKKKEFQQTAFIRL